MPFAPPSQKKLAANVELLDQLAISIDIFPAEITQQPLALTHQIQQGPAASVILLVFMQMLGKTLNSIREQGNLSFNRTCVLGVAAILLEDLFDLLFGQILWHNVVFNRW